MKSHKLSYIISFFIPKDGSLKLVKGTIFSKFLQINRKVKIRQNGIDLLEKKCFLKFQRTFHSTHPYIINEGL